uniref:Uncharacterized protein n=1 Tax=Anguilla anguilla TaxID=7936 RepID=A0A0E9T3D4_ANGAN
MMINEPPCNIDTVSKITNRMGEMTQEVHSVGSLSPLKSKCVSQAAPVIHSLSLHKLCKP